MTDGSLHDYLPTLRAAAEQYAECLYLAWVKAMADKRYGDGTLIMITVNGLDEINDRLLAELDKIADGE